MEDRVERAFGQDPEAIVEEDVVKIDGSEVRVYGGIEDVGVDRFFAGGRGAREGEDSPVTIAAKNQAFLRGIVTYYATNYPEHVLGVKRNGNGLVGGAAQIEEEEGAGGDGEREAGADWAEGLAAQAIGGVPFAR